MTTTTNAAAADPILTIDRGKYKSVACIVRSAAGGISRLG
jgi:hypothetical protein